MIEKEVLIECLVVLYAVNRGWIPFTSIKEDPCYPEWTIATGHRVKAFNDAGSLDYFEGITLPNGTYVDFTKDGLTDPDTYENYLQAECMYFHADETVWQWDKANGW